ncbi:MAG: NUDIX hydrolase [Actinomycetota bacterium]
MPDDRPDAVHTGFAGRFLRIDVEDWGPGRYEVVRRVTHAPDAPGAVGVLPVTAAGEAVLVRQFRQPVRRAILEIPAGLMDVEGEAPEVCAVRELFEETGYRPGGELVWLGTFLTTPGISDERIALYRVDTAAEPEGVPEDGIEVVRMPLAEARVAVSDGRIVDAKTAVAVLLTASSP